MRTPYKPKSHLALSKISGATQSYDTGKRLNRIYQRNRLISQLKETLNLLVIVTTCVGVIYLLGYL